MRCAEKKESDEEIAERDMASASDCPVEAKKLRQTLVPSFHSSPCEWKETVGNPNEIPVPIVNS